MLLSWTYGWDRALWEECCKIRSGEMVFSEIIVDDGSLTVSDIDAIMKYCRMLKKAINDGNKERIKIYGKQLRTILKNGGV